MCPLLVWKLFNWGSCLTVFGSFWLFGFLGGSTSIVSLSRYSASACWIRTGPPGPWTKESRIERDRERAIIRLFHRRSGHTIRSELASGFQRMKHIDLETQTTTRKRTETETRMLQTQREIRWIPMFNNNKNRENYIWTWPMTNTYEPLVGSTRASYVCRGLTNT